MAGLAGLLAVEQFRRASLSGCDWWRKTDRRSVTVAKGNDEEAARIEGRHPRMELLSKAPLVLATQVGVLAGHSNILTKTDSPTSDDAALRSSGRSSDDTSDALETLGGKGGT